jgi:hypothetical protein
MSGYDLVRSWKDPDEPNASGHPAGDIVLDDLNGVHGGLGTLTGVLCDLALSWLLACNGRQLPVDRIPL